MKFIEELVWILKLSDFEQTVVLRLIFAAIAGGLVGMERELKGRPAGMKTFSLVCVGATMVMITNELSFKWIGRYCQTCSTGNKWDWIPWRWNDYCDRK